MDDDFKEGIDMALKDHMEKMMNSPRNLTMLNMFKAIQSQEVTKEKDLMVELEFPNADDNETAVEEEKNHKKHKKKLSDKKGEISLKNLEQKEESDFNINKWLKENLTSKKSSNKNSLYFLKEFKASCKSFVNILNEIIIESSAIKNEVPKENINPKITSFQELEPCFPNNPEPPPVSTIPSIPPVLLNTSQYGKKNNKHRNIFIKCIKQKYTLL